MVIRDIMPFKESHHMGIRKPIVITVQKSLDQEWNKNSQQKEWMHIFHISPNDRTYINWKFSILPRQQQINKTMVLQQRSAH